MVGEDWYCASDCVGKWLATTETGWGSWPGRIRSGMVSGLWRDYFNADIVSRMRIAMTRLAFFATILLAPGLGWAAAPPVHDCAPLGSLPAFVGDANTVKPYDTVQFQHKAASGDIEPIDVSGQLCIAHYQLRPGKDTPSNLEIQSNYKLQLQQLGAEITLGEPS